MESKAFLYINFFDYCCKEKDYILLITTTTKKLKLEILEGSIIVDYNFNYLNVRNDKNEKSNKDANSFRVPERT